jgi:hypothetical protein
MTPTRMETLRALVAASDADIASGGDGWVRSKQIFPNQEKKQIAEKLWPLFGVENVLDWKYLAGPGKPLAWRPNAAGRAMIDSALVEETGQ